MAFFALKRDAAPGVDGLTWRTYEADLDRNLTDLHERVHRGAYRALPSRRTYIPKADGKQRPLAVAALEDTRRGARQRAGLTPASASNTLSCLLEMLHSKQLRSIKMLVDSSHGIYREQGGASCRSSHVRNAPLATLGPIKAACREAPTTEVGPVYSIFSLVPAVDAGC